MAAVEAADAGASVLLVDKQPDVGGGATGMAVGSITAAGTDLQREAGIKDSVEAHYQTVLEMIGRAEAARPGETYDRDLTRLMVEVAPRAVARLAELGVEFSGPHPEPPHPVYRMHNGVPSSRAYIEVLRRAAEERGVVIRPNTALDELQRDEGGAAAVVSLRHVRAQQSTVVRARCGVILAAGDFSANDDLARAHGRTPEVSAVPPLQPGATGDALVAAIEVGAGAVALHRGGGASFRTALAPYCAERDLFIEGGILVNRLGRRFADETQYPALAANEQPDRQCYLVFDARLAARIATAEDDSTESIRDGWYRNGKLFLSTFPGVAYAYVEDYRQHTDYFFETGNLEELATAISVPAESLVETAAALDEAAAGKRPDEFGRDPAPPGLSAAPFCAVGPIKPVIIFSAGGLAVDHDLRVLDGDGEPIPHLYAAGATAEAAVFLGGHGHHLAWAFGTGMIAGRNAAAERPVD